MIDRDNMINKVLIDSDEAQTLKHKLQHLEELKEYLTPNEYKFSMANIVAAECVKSVGHRKDIVFTRQQILIKVNTILKNNGVEPVSYQFIRKFY